MFAFTGIRGLDGISHTAPMALAEMLRDVSDGMQHFMQHFDMWVPTCHPASRLVLQKPMSAAFLSTSLSTRTQPNLEGDLTVKKGKAVFSVNSDFRNKHSHTDSYRVIPSNQKALRCT